MVMKRQKVLVDVVVTLFVALLLFFAASPVNAQDKPPKHNIIDGELYPHGYTPMEIKNGFTRATIIRTPRSIDLR
jgi:hypothetical protein